MNPLDPLKSALEMAKIANRLDLIEKLNDAYSAMNGLIQHEGELTIELKKAKLKIDELEGKIADAGKVEAHHGVYWRRRENKTLDGPFSPLAWDRDRKTLRMKFNFVRDHAEGSKALLYFDCPESKHSYPVPSGFIFREKVFSQEELEHILARPPSTGVTTIARRRNRVIP